MTRVGLFLDFPPEGGGAFQYAQAMLSAVKKLDRTRYEVVVAYVNPAWAALVSDKNAGVRVVAVRPGPLEALTRMALRGGFPLGLFRMFAPALHQVTRVLRRLACDVWIFPAQDVMTYAVPCAAIGVIHDLMHRHESQFSEVSKAGLFRRRERHYRRMCEKSKAILVDSELGRSHVLAAYTIEPTKVVVLPFVAPGYMFSATMPRSNYAFPGRYFFYPAQFWEHKNHVRLLHAFKEARASVPDLHLVLAGSRKNAYPQIIKTIKALDLTAHVTILGYVPDEEMPSLYAGALGLVMPTFFGPTNIPPLEAMAAGCPVAVSRIYAMPEQMGDAALWLDPTSMQDIARAMIELATDASLRTRLVEAGRLRSLAWRQPDFDARVAYILDNIFSRP